MAKLLSDFVPIAPSATADRIGNMFIFSLNSGIAMNNSPSYFGDGVLEHKYVWTVPSGTSTVRFDIWGAGGNGAAAFCCMMGLDAGSGAWAYKTLTNVSAGDRYVFCLGPTCCRNCQNNGAHCSAAYGGGCNVTDQFGHDATQADQFLLSGSRGATTSVTGPGLTNFCAEGGNGGVTVYRGWTSNNARCRASTGDNFQGVVSTCCTLFQMCDYTGMTDPDSASSRFRKADYYGADGGARGVYACFMNGCCGNYLSATAHSCGSRMFSTIPGGKWYARGAFTECGGTYGNHWGSENIGSQGSPHGTGPRQGRASVISMNNFDNGGQGIGNGGYSAATCAGTCCCGGYGGAGAVMVTYR